MVKAALDRFKEDLGTEGRRFHYELAYRDLGRTLDRIQSFYEAGAMEWAREERPDLVDRLRTAFRAVDTAFDREDHRAVDAALRNWAAAAREIVLMFRGSPQFQASDEALPEIQVDQVEPETESLFPEEDRARETTSSHRGAL
ncbi:hypothetical protein [Desulfuromonas sp. TF]|uniref:hypothetical protein n=1 Tax=Desulfuromonas sp. TF TaxID=1232410 RepID=UPI000410C699|nr:hypothetical protein [Desulfuromonas sp. TF]